jgi:membrane fusion protein (multidrug efflux system)
MCNKRILILFLYMLPLYGCERDLGERQAMPPTEVGFVTVTTRDVQIWQELSGRVKASLQADVRPQVDGIVQERLFNEGEYVVEGQVLYRLDADSYRAAFSQATAALKTAEANITATRLKSERYAQLAKEDGIARQDVDDAVAAYQQALAVVEEKRALLETASINFERTEIKAPISGFIGISSITVGQLVTANQSGALATIRSLDPIYVDITQSSAQKLRLRRSIENNKLRNGNTEVQLRLEDGTVYEHKGTLQLQEIAVDESTGAVTLRAKFPNPEGVLLPGMFVRAVVSEAVHENAVLVKQQAVTRNAKEEGFVMVLTPENVVERRTVITGPTAGGTWIIFDGLKAGDKVILEGLNKIRSGDTVRAVEITKDDGDVSQNLPTVVRR